MDTNQFRLTTEHLTIEGRSRAGHETYFRVRELGVALDIGRCPDFLVGVPHVFITHAHLDHAAGIPFYAGQRHLQGLAGGLLYVPSETVDDFRALMKLHEKLEGTGYDIEFTGMAPGDLVPLGKNHSVRAHAASHRVAARAYEFLEVRHHLRREYASLGSEKLASLRRDGVSVHEETAVPVLFYTGDTDRGIFEGGDAIFKAEVLMIECSFVGEGHQSRAEKYRHIHFDDIADMADRFENRLIVLTHFSRRYPPAEIVSELRRRAPAALRERLRLALPEPWQRIG